MPSSTGRPRGRWRSGVGWRASGRVRARRATTRSNASRTCHPTRSTLPSSSRASGSSSPASSPARTTSATSPIPCSRTTSTPSTCRVADALVAAGVDTILWGTCAPMSQEVVPRNYPAAFRASRAPERQSALAAVVTRVAATHPAVDGVGSRRARHRPSRRPDPAPRRQPLRVGVRRRRRGRPSTS